MLCESCKFDITFSGRYIVASCKRANLCHRLPLKTNRKSYMGSPSVSLELTLSDPER